MKKQHPPEFQLLLQYIADFTNDINYMADEIKTLENDIKLMGVSVEIMIQHEAYIAAKIQTKCLNKFKYKLEKTECVMKTLIACRLPYQNAAIKLRQLYAIIPQTENHERDLKWEIDKIYSTMGIAFE